MNEDITTELGLQDAINYLNRDLDAHVLNGFVKRTQDGSVLVVSEHVRLEGYFDRKSLLSLLVVLENNNA